MSSPQPGDNPVAPKYSRTRGGNNNPEGITRRQEPTTAAMFDHCKRVYDRMLSESQDFNGVILYEGHLTKLFTQMNFSVPYYSMVTRKLKDMGCIRMLRRGGGGSLSQWEMLTEPTPEAFKVTLTAAQRGKGSERGNKTGQELDALKQQIRDLTSRMNMVEDALRQLVNGDVA
jgi:hypothetical protein